MLDDLTIPEPRVLTGKKAVLLQISEWMTAGAERITLQPGSEDGKTWVMLARMPDPEEALIRREIAREAKP